MLRALVSLAMCVGAVGCAHAQEHSYVMQPGDTLYSVSRRLDVTVDQLKAVNGIEDETNVAVGTRLRVGPQSGLRPLAPGAVGRSSPDAAPARTYAMAEGDTLYSIAARLDLDVGDLMQVNDIDDPRDVAAGTELTLDGVRPRAAGPGGPRLWPTAGDLMPLTGKLDGVAISGAAGQPVRSVSSGTVTWSGPHRGYKYVVLVRKDGYVYAYLNNDQVLVQVGDEVQVGSEIGRLGGGADGDTAQLYFVVTKNGRFVDPGSAPRA